MKIPSRLSSAFIGSGLVAAVAHYDAFAIAAAGFAVAVELLVFFNSGLVPSAGPEARLQRDTDAFLSRQRDGLG